MVRKCDPDSNAYIVKAADGCGKTKTVNFIDLRVCKVCQSSESQTDTDTDSSPDELCIPSMSEDEATEPQGAHPKLRRSQRKTAGKQSNPYNLPRSAVKESIRMESGIDYAEFSKAVNNLGATMVDSLGKLLQKGPIAK